MYNYCVNECTLNGDSNYVTALITPFQLVLSSSAKDQLEVKRAFRIFICVSMWVFQTHWAIIVTLLPGHLSPIDIILKSIHFKVLIITSHLIDHHNYQGDRPSIVLIFFFWSVLPRYEVKEFYRRGEVWLIKIWQPHFSFWLKVTWMR